MVLAASAVLNTPNPSDTTPVRRVLMVAFQFPPFAMSSGVQRTLRFVQHLPMLGWQPIVLSADSRAYASVSMDLLSEIPAGTIVARPFALDAARHLSIAGRYPAFLARPDRWRSWAFAAVREGMKLIRDFQPDILWCTYPIATAHTIGLKLHRLSGIPLVADFRDPMAQDGYPADPRTWQAFSDIEHDLSRLAAKMVFVTPGALAIYSARFPAVDMGRFALIENGYDEMAFADAERATPREPLNPGLFTLLHSGVVYPSERDPSALMAAMGRMKRAGRVSASGLRLRFRAPVHDGLLRQLADQEGVTDLIEILPALPYREALGEMLCADGLLVLQGSNCNAQIPAKIYEYLRARRPILGLADPGGDTATLLRSSGVDHVARLEDSMQVESTMSAFLADVPRCTPPLSPSDQVASMSRLARSRELVRVMESLIARPRACGH